jgi:NDP-sugar pyrophosphorylase family protein
MFKYGLIIAGGTGTRMKPLTDYVPKPLVKYKDKELISYNLDFFKTNGISHTIVTYGYKSELLTNFLEKKVNCLLNTIDKDNSYFLFNTIIKHIDEPILLLPCDIIIDLDVEKLYQEYIDLGSPSCLIVPLKNDRKVEADFLHTNGNKIIKINREEESNFYASGIQIINPNKINNKIKSSENFYNVWMELIKNEELLISNTNVYFWEAIDNFNQII